MEEKNPDFHSEPPSSDTYTSSQNQILPASASSPNRSIKILVFLAALLLISGAGYYVFQYKQPIHIDTPMPVAVEQVSPTPEPQYVATPSSAWKLDVPISEQLASVSLTKNKLVYATKNEFTSKVFVRDISTGTESQLFTFNERSKANRETGNLWEGLPPNIALSNDGEQLAYIDDVGLKTIHMKTKVQKSLVSITIEGQGDDSPPEWTAPTFDSVYLIARPLWSFDGSYISVLKGLYEGARFAIFDSKTGAVVSKPWPFGGGYKNLIWSPTQNVIAKASAGGYEGSGLFVSSPESIAEIVDYGKKHDFGEETTFREVAFSHDGQTIAFTTNVLGIGSMLGVGSITGDSPKLTSIKPELMTPFFSPNGKSVYGVEQFYDQLALVMYDIENESKEIIVLFPNTYNDWKPMGWTAEGYLVMSATLLESGLTIGGDSTQFFILDLNTQKIVYNSKQLSEFTLYAGLTQ